MTGRWWRAYDEAVDEPKLILLSDAQHRAWFNLLCLASANGGKLPELKIICVKLRMSSARAAKLVQNLIDAALLDRGGGKLVPHNWNGRQYKSDVSTERVKRFRKRQRNVSETPPETDTETDTETEKKKKEKPGKKLLPGDWQPNLTHRLLASSKGLSEQEFTEAVAEMRDWSIGNGQKRSNWDAVFSNWLRRNAAKRRTGSGQHRESIEERGKRLADKAREFEFEAGIGSADDPFRSH
jgi:hypothetical protein